MDAEVRVWRLDLAYEGTSFYGWSRQPGLRTVEGVLETALATVLREPVRLSVAGRTDRGVHALAQVASFATSAPVEPERLRLSLNALLPPDVAVRAVVPVPSGFVARAASARTYRYRLWASPVRPVLEREVVWHVHDELDADLLAHTAALLTGRRDFAALTPSAREYHSCVREVTAATWRAAPSPELHFEITAGSFLHMMVRVAVGSMVDVARGRLDLEEVAAALDARDRSRLGCTAPPRGLALVRVDYD
jgi:tRNA pseudouridine38-40 synthase